MTLYGSSVPGCLNFKIKVSLIICLIKDDILDIEELACNLIRLLHLRYPHALKERYGIDVQEDIPGYELLEMAGRRRGFLISGGEINTERMAKVLVEEYRRGKLGRFTSEEPKG